MELEKWTEQTATAVRLVVDLDEIGTMCAEPVGVRCVSFGRSATGWEVVFGGFCLGEEGGAEFVE